MHLAILWLSDSTKNLDRHNMAQADKTPLYVSHMIWFSDADHYYSASDHSDEDSEEWAHGLNVPAVDDHSSPSNNIKILLRLECIISKQWTSTKGSSNKTYNFHNPYTVRISWTPPTHLQILTATKINSYTCKTRFMYLLKYLIIPI